MKKLLTILAATAVTLSAAFAAPATGVDPQLPKTKATVLDDFEDGMYLTAIRDGWDEFGNKFMESQFSTASKTEARWDGNGECGVLEYAALPGNSAQGCIYECTDMTETNWKDMKYLAVTVYNPNDYSVALQFYTKTGDKWQWGNTDTYNVEQGVHTVVFPITAQTVVKAADVKAFGFAFYIGGAHPESKIYIDDLTLYGKK